MKSNSLLTWVLGVAALGVTVYVVGRAWKMSQKSTGVKLTSTDADFNKPTDEQATFVDDYDNAAGGNRLTAIAKAGGFRNAAGVDPKRAKAISDSFRKRINI